MNEQELQSILNSDMKLWDRAETIEEGTTLIKVLDLPYGIGRTEIRLEGIDDAIKRRGALESFGEYIRGIVENKIGEESITARAQSKAALAGPAASDNYGGRAPTVETEPGGAPTFSKSAMAPLDAFDFSAEALASRRDELSKLGDDYTGRLEALRLQIQAVDAVIELYKDGSSTHKKTPSGS